MFSKQAEYKSTSGGYRKYVWAAIGATAAVLGGAALFSNVTEEPSFDHSEAFEVVNYLSNHRDYMVDQHNTITELIAEGYERKQDTMNAIIQLNKSNKVDMKGHVVPGLKGGTVSLDKNVKFGDKTTKDTVHPEQITKNFADSANFAAKIYKMFPKEYQKVTALRQDLKVHHFDLGNAIKDVELLATTTSENLRKSIKKLQLRKRYLDGDKLKPLTDAKIWRYEVQYQTTSLQDSLEKCDAIVKVLEKLQKDCARTSDNLENVLRVIKEELKKKISAGKASLADLEKQAAASKCTFWQMIFTFGKACRNANKLKAELTAKIGNLRAQTEVAAELDGKFHYFDNLKKLAKTLTSQASGLLDTTKEFRSRLDSTVKELKQDFTEEEIDDQLGDEDFMNDFAEQLYDTFERLGQTCAKTVTDCINRKKALTDALIWNKVGEEDLMELNGSDEAEVMNQFYNELASGCTNWYTSASNKFLSDVQDMKQTITQLGTHKHIIMNYAREEFHTVKGSLFNIVDGLIDSQRAIESTTSYFMGRVTYMKKKIDNDAWKFELKYSTGLTKRCESDHARVSSFESLVHKNSASIASHMNQVHAKFIHAGQKDLKAWDCDAMYPEPQPIDIGVPKWLGGVTKFAKQGFEIYNKVKKFIPGGSKAGAGPVPGGPEDAADLVELMDVDWGKVKETGIGLGKKLWDEMEKDMKAGEESMKSRRKIWRAALGMCNNDKQAFIQELKATDASIQALAKPVHFSTDLEKFTIGKELNIYTKKANSMRDGTVTEDEMAANKANLSVLEQDVIDAHKAAKTNGHAAEALKAALIK